jgi:hypothetical protein
MIRPLLFLLFVSLPCFARECIPFDRATEHIGRTECVKGKVLTIGQSEAGSFFLDFCEDYRKCPFVVVVFRSNLQNVGDVRQLEGKEIEITGKIREWRNRAEIILKDARQLEGMAGKLPRIPTTYDADHKGNYSAGKYTGPRSKHPTHRRNSQLPADEIDAE